MEEAGRQLIEAAKALSPKSTEAPVNQPQEVVRLTHYSHGLGCACKLRPQDLETVVRDLKVLPHPDILVGPETADDAAVYRINDETALVETLDFFSPVVDDPYYFGAIAAANALSDVYAMGGTPLFALNIVAFPSKRLSLQVLRDILKGAQDKADEAGIPVLGGHTIEDNEPKYGMVVTGKVHPTKFWTNSGAQPGDALILTKPLGTGIYSTALKRGLLTQEQSDKLYQQMATLNAKAAGVFHDFTVHACTDVTGFGLTGHLRELAKGSAVDVELDYLSIPWMQSLFSLMVAGAIPGGTRNNLAYAEPWTEWNGSFSEHEKLALCDAQTSGGLLVAVPAGESEEILRALEDAGVVRAARIGHVLRSGEGKISVSK
ncbi:MAG: selenide, water dikinase SelD [Bacteroidales bacterium]